MTENEIRNCLKFHNQEHLLRFYNELNAEEKNELLISLSKIDYSFENDFQKPSDLSGKGHKITPINGLTIEEINERREFYKQIGLYAIRKGKVALLLLAGGQGTRLDFEHAKGMFNIGETKNISIFAQQMSNLLEVVKEAGVEIPLYVMTSEINNAETVAFWQENGYFGYSKENVKFFTQDMSPTVDFNGKIYLDEKYKVSLSPNGNGGWFSSICKSKLDKDMEERGIEWINVYAVDNVLQRIGDPVFIGATVYHGVECGAKVVSKTCPEEKVGVLCNSDGKPAVIEYYELTEEMANMRDENGKLSYVYGVILNYLFKYSRLKEIQNEKMPVHIVKKKIPYINENGIKVKPEKENGYKFETLAVDIINLMNGVLPFEVEREKEFAPVKNATGTDSVETARILLKNNGVEL